MHIVVITDERAQRIGRALGKRVNSFRSVVRQVDQDRELFFLKILYHHILSFLHLPIFHLILFPFLPLPLPLLLLLLLLLPLLISEQTFPKALLIL